MIKRGLIGGLPLVVCAVLVLSSCGVRPLVSQNAFQETVDIGLVGTFSGAASMPGDYLQHSLQVEVDALNAGGGLLGKRVEVIAADDEGNPDKARFLVHQLATDPDIKLVVGPNATATFLAAKVELGRTMTPNCVAVQISDDALQGASTSFSTEASMAATLQALLANLRQRRPDARRLGLIAQDGPDGRAYDSRLAGQARAAGLDYAGADFIVDPTVDQQPLVQDMLTKGVQAIMLPGDPALAGRTAQAVGLLGQDGKLQLLGSSALSSSLYADSGGQSAMGTVFASTIQTDQTDAPKAQWPAAYRQFVDSITSQYGYAAGGTQIQGWAPAADCVVNWAASVRAANGFGGSQVVRAWAGLDQPATATVLATHERFTPTNHQALGNDALFVYQWQTSGTQRRLKELAGP